MISYTSLKELADEATKKNIRISDVVIEEQSNTLCISKEKVFEMMKKHFDVMKESIEKGKNSSKLSNSGLSGGDAKKIYSLLQNGKPVTGTLMCKAICNAIAVAEVNACMGKIVAAPTAGSCGIIPAVIITLGEENNISEENMVSALLNAAGVGLVIANTACISGAQGGCQAECGSASAMAASAAVEMLGGTPQMCLSAVAFALQNMLGLVCDPVGGLVEVPCIKRNVNGAVNAMASVEMALAELSCIIPADEVISAMKAVGDSMNTSLKETALGGMAACKTAKKLFN